MSVEEKVGQLFSTHVYGNTVDSYDANNVAEFGLGTPREIIEKYHLGGVLYFAWTHSVDNPKQAAGLSNGIQQVSTSTGAKVPQLISIDQEGGLVARVLEPATQTPGNMALGATRDVKRHPRPRGHPGHRARGHGDHAELRTRWPTSTSTRPTR